MAERQRAKNVRVGDSVPVENTAFVRLPDGSVVSAREAYTFRVPGDHVIGDTTHSVQSAK